ncbi:MAG TPA: diguanylate cyclase [Terriglobia bacterium]|nr:diguanylate cyclase [Terriglobia bacterium]
MKILIAEDDAVSRRVVESRLQKWGYEVVSVTDGDAAWHVLQQDVSPQLAILDWMMPGMDGPSICRAVRQAHGRYVYILLLTAKGHERDLVEGLESGADDYLIKPVSPEELKAHLYAAARILEAQEQLISAREELRAQAIRDPLTGLFNRRYMEESLGRELHRALRNQQSLGVIMLDLDHFKRFNDAAGHAAGDALLKELGSLLQFRTRKEDIACRYGGEEFTVILPGMPLDLARSRAEELRAAMKDARIEHRGQSLGPVTLSVGVAAAPDHGATAEEILQAADEALYQAKAEGRDRVVVSSHAAPPSVGPARAAGSEARHASGFHR